jgi:hypothetical protein
MIENLTDMPPGTLGFRAAGDVERGDHDRALMIPGEARVYPLAELDQAKAWVAGDA